jgi:hypothetical protein
MASRDLRLIVVITQGSQVLLPTIRWATTIHFMADPPVDPSRVAVDP